jgi:lipoyl(octanoyl) transferase
VVRTERGGQVTYHGPGQVVAYPLMDLRRLGLYVKEYVFRLEQAVLDTLADWGVTGHRVRTAPGIYVRLDDPFSHAALAPYHQLPESGAALFTGLGKVAALGVKLSRHCSYHGLALNVDPRLGEFDRIHPCGYPGLATTSMRALGARAAPDTVADRHEAHLADSLERARVSRETLPAEQVCGTTVALTNNPRIRTHATSA